MISLYELLVLLMSLSSIALFSIVSLFDIFIASVLRTYYYLLKHVKTKQHIFHLIRHPCRDSNPGLPDHSLTCMTNQTARLWDPLLSLFFIELGILAAYSGVPDFVLINGAHLSIPSKITSSRTFHDQIIPDTILSSFANLFFP